MWIFKCRICRSLGVGPSSLNLKQVFQMIFIPILLNLEEHCFKIKVINPTQDNPSYSKIAFSLSPLVSSSYQHQLLTTSCQSALSTAIILPFHIPDPLRSGRVWKQDLHLADRHRSRQVQNTKLWSTAISRQRYYQLHWHTIWTEKLKTFFKLFQWGRMQKRRELGTCGLATALPLTSFVTSIVVFPHP